MRPISTTDLYKIAPSAFASHASPDTTERYHYASTSQIIEHLRSNGYVPVQAGQGLSRRPDGSPYARHVIRMCHERYITDSRTRQVGDVIPEAVITNSHDKSSALSIDAGLRRLICSNGLAVDAGTFASVRILHSNPRINELVLEGLTAVEKATEAVVVPQIERMLALEMTRGQERDFAVAATVLRFGKERPDEAERLLQLRREADAGRNMWAVLNRIQENAVRGGYPTVDAGGRRRMAGAITSPVRDLDFNMQLWRLGALVTEELTA
jgi:hypothetical protein